MRGPENQVVPYFFDIEQRLAPGRPLRIIEAVIDPVLKQVAPALDEMYF